MNRITLHSVMLLTCGTLMTQECLGLGIRQPDLGASATAQNDAFIAQSDDATAIAYNPAGLTQITGSEFIGGTMIYGAHSEYSPSAASGNTDASTQQPISLVPHFYAVSDFGLKWFRAGIGIYTPFGQKLDWGDDAPFRFVTTRASLQMVNINPTVAFLINDHLSVAAGLDYFYCDTDVRRGFPFGVLGEGQFRFKGQGDGLGFNAGLMWKINEQHRIGVTYRSQVHVNFDGHGTVSSIPAGAQFFFGLPPTVEQDGDAGFQFPDIVQIGYAYWPTPKWKIELDADWTHWDVVNTLSLNSPGLLAVFGPLGATQSTLDSPLNWQDSWIVELGTQYEVKENVFLRGGFYWSQNSVPGDTVSPFLPDSNRIGLSAGVGFKCKQWTVNLAYQANIALDRTVNNTVGATVGQSVNGDYSGYSHAGVIEVGFHF